jgi:hypothetical protein
MDPPRSTAGRAHPRVEALSSRLVTWPTMRSPAPYPVLVVAVFALACEPPPSKGAPLVEDAGVKASPPPPADSASQAPLTLLCFSDGSHDICLADTERPEPTVVYVDGEAISAIGQWRSAPPRVPQLEVRLGTERGPTLRTGPNGALRVTCPSARRQYFKGRRVPLEQLVSGGPAAAGTPLCERLGLGGPAQE